MIFCIPFFAVVVTYLPLNRVSGGPFGHHHSKSTPKVGFSHQNNRRTRIESHIAAPLSSIIRDEAAAALGVCVRLFP